MQQIAPPWGQSFTPTFSSVGFTRLMLDDANLSDGRGATVYINLHSDSITGAVIGTTAAMSMANAFAGPVTFLFPRDVPATSGTAYYFEPIVQSGGAWDIAGGEYNYPGGSFYFNGQPRPASDLWFRGGIVVPEPSAVALLLAGAGLWVWIKRKHAQ